LLIGVLSDIHANLPALETVLAWCYQHQVEMLFVVGDIVGYYTKPTEVVGLLQENHTHVVMGNHDMAVVGGVFADKFTTDFLGSLTETFIAAKNLDALEAIAWTITHVNPMIADMLLNETYAKFRVEGLNFGLCHGMPSYVRNNLTDEVGYYMNKENIEENAQKLSEFCVKEDLDFLFSGHTHAFYHLQLKHGSKIINLVNPGSVGQPRDGNPQLSFAVLEVEEGNCKSVENIRLDYNLELTQEGIYREQLPEFLAQRLEKGI